MTKLVTSMADNNFCDRLQNELISKRIRLITKTQLIKYVKDTTGQYIKPTWFMKKFLVIFTAFKNQGQDSRFLRPPFWFRFSGSRGHEIWILGTITILFGVNNLECIFQKLLKISRLTQRSNFRNQAHYQTMPYYTVSCITRAPSRILVRRHRRYLVNLIRRTITQ